MFHRKTGGGQGGRCKGMRTFLTNCLAKRYPPGPSPAVAIQNCQTRQGDTCEQHDHCTTLCIKLGWSEHVPRSQPVCPIAGGPIAGLASGIQSIKALPWQRRAASAAAVVLPCRGTAETYTYSCPHHPLTPFPCWYLFEHQGFRDVPDARE